MSYRGGTIDWSYEPLLWKRGSEGEKRYNRAAYGNPKNMQTQKRLFLLRRRAGGDFAPANHSFYNFYERFLLKDHKNFEFYKPQYFAKGYTGSLLSSVTAIPKPWNRWSRTSAIISTTADIRKPTGHR